MQPEVLFGAYSFVALPDLSTLRRPPRLRESTQIQVHPQCTEQHLLLALARCLGAYCASSDILLGWQQRHSPAASHGSDVSPDRAAGTDKRPWVALARRLGIVGSQPRHAPASSDAHVFPDDANTNAKTITAARVSWAHHDATWESTLHSIAFKEIADDSESVRRVLGLELDPAQSPFVAVVSPNADYDHPLVLSLDSDTSTVYIRYSTRVLHASTAVLLAEQLRELATRIIEHPHTSAKTAAFLPQRLLSAVEPTATASPGAGTGGSSPYTHIPEARFATDLVAVAALHASLAEHTALEFHPDLYAEDGCTPQTLTYGALHACSSQFAAYLLAQGVQQEDRVALCLPRDVAFHVCLLGIFKAGACYVPIDPELPPERRAFIAQDSDARLVLTADNIAAHVAAARAFPTADVNRARAGGLAYLLYTSGTTGAPKGCLLTHDGLAQAIHALSWFANQAGPHKEQWPQPGRYLAIASVAFDVHLAEMLVAFALGMTLVAAPRAQLFEDLPQWLHALRITHVGIVPSLIEATMLALVESGGGSSADNSNGDADGAEAMELVYIASGGEKMSDSILEKWADHPLVNLANFYGPSEVTIGCAARFMSSETRKENIGRIFENCSAYVVDEDLNVVMRGAVGELVVGGRLVGSGYHERPDLTQKVFVDWQGGKAYRTGDLVRLMPDGTLEILGRIDTQIKLRGVRIEAEGVSAVIRNAAAGVPGLGTGQLDVSTVLARHPRLGADQLVSFVAWGAATPVAHRRAAAPAVLPRAPPGLMRAIRDACARDLASYMRPAHVVPLTFLPLNANGKADGKALVALFQAESLEALGKAATAAERPGAAEETVTGSGPGRPLNKVEADIADLVSQFTAVPRAQMQPRSDLFELGLDSLKLVRLASEIRTRCSLGRGAVSLSIGHLVQNPTLASVAELVDGMREHARTASESDAPRESVAAAFGRQWMREAEGSLGADAVECVLPTFPVQDGVLYRSADLGTLYVQHVVLRLHDDISTERLRGSWIAVMAHHEILRTVFQFATVIIQVVLKPDSCELPWSERTTEKKGPAEFTSAFLETDALEIASDINGNISTKPPFRLVLHQSAAARFLTVSIHHSIYDGITLPLLLRDVETLYLGAQLPLPPGVPLAEVLDAVYDVDYDEAATFWRQWFADFDWASLPHRSASGETAHTASLELVDSLRDWEARTANAKVSLQALLMASFGICLGRHMYDSSDVVFGVIRAGRSFADDALNAAQCPLLSVLPARVKTAGGVDILQAVQHDIGVVLPYEHVPLSRVQQWVQPGKSLFEVLFSVTINTGGGDSQICEILESAQPQADHILAVEIVLDQGTGKVRADSAYTHPVTQAFTMDLLRDFEATARLLAEGGAVAHIPMASALKEASGASGDYEDDSEDENIDEASINQELEDNIRKEVSRFLGLDEERISSTDSLIALGLDSIKSVGLSRALRKTVKGMKITAMDLMLHSTIRRIAARQTKGAELASTSEAEEAEGLLRAARVEILQHVDIQSVATHEEDLVELYPVTMLQAGMLSQTISSDGHLYVHAFPFKLADTVDLERLRGTWRKAVDQLSILRTSFHFLGDLGIWAQAVHSRADLKWSETEMPSTPLADTIEHFISSVGLSSEYAFATPPVYLRLLRGTQDSQHVLVLVIHHALYDGISMSNMSSTLKRLHRGEVTDQSHQFVDLLGYFKYQELHGTDFWVKYLANYSRPVLPRAAPSSGMGTRSSSRDIPLDSTRLNEACRHFETTVQCFGQAAWAKGLVRLYGRRDVVFGHVVSGRNTNQAESVLGPMISTLPCRVQLSPGLKNLDFVRSIHRGNLAASRWQHASLRSVQHKFGLGDLWDSIFLFQPPEDDTYDNNDLWWFDESTEEIAKVQYPLNIELHQLADRLIVKAACQSDVMTAVGLDDVLDRFSRDLIIIITHPSDIAIGDLSLSESLGSLTNGDIIGRKRIDRTGHLDGISSNATDTWEPHSPVAPFLELLAASAQVPLTLINPNTLLVSLGIDSISAIQISARARGIGLRIHAADILQCQTAMDFLKVVSSKETRQPEELCLAPSSTPPETLQRLLPRLGVHSSRIGDIAPATAGMSWLVGMYQLSNCTRFQHAFAFALPRDVDQDILRSAWVNLVDTNAILRSTFASVDQSNVYVVTFKDLPNERLWSTRNVLDDKRSDKEVVADLMRNLVSSPLSTNRPPVQAIFLRCNGSPYLILHLHHFQYDAWSLRLLVADLDRIYRGEKVTSSSDLSSFLRESIPTPPQEEEQRQFWQSYLHVPFAPSILPKLRKEEERKERLVFTRHDVLSDLPSLRRRARDLSISLNAVFLACWARVQAEYSQADSATFGLWHLGRSGGVEDIAALAVPCMNVLPVHVTVGQSPLLGLCRGVQMDLRRRTATVEQSRLEDIYRWVVEDTPNKGALCNVFVNIVVEAETEGNDSRGLLLPLEVPYYIPKSVSPTPQTTAERLAICDLVQDAVMIDIVANGRAVALSFEYSNEYLDTDKAHDLLDSWAASVNEALGD